MKNKFVGGQKINIFSNFREFCRQICDLIENQSMGSAFLVQVATNQRNLNFRIVSFLNFGLLSIFKYLLPNNDLLIYR